MKSSEAIALVESAITKTFYNDQVEENYRKYLLFCANFHEYSFSNLLLLFYQNPSATYVAGFNKWKKLGRYVKKGEKGMTIIFPMVYGSKKSDSDSDDSDDGFRQVYFNVGYVFDISQTEGAELPEHPKVAIQQGLTMGEVFLMLDFAEVDFRWSSDPGCQISLTANGAFRKPSMEGQRPAIILNKKKMEVPNEDGSVSFNEAKAIKTLLHEYAHYYYWKNKLSEPNYDDNELIAESVAFLICNDLGIDTTDYSFSYLRNYSTKNHDASSFRTMLKKISVCKAGIFPVRPDQTMAGRVEVNYAHV